MYFLSESIMDQNLSNIWRSSFSPGPSLRLFRHQEDLKIRIGKKNFSEPDWIHLVGTEEVKGAGINSLPGGQKQVNKWKKVNACQGTWEHASPEILAKHRPEAGTYHSSRAWTWKCLHCCYVAIYWKYFKSIKFHLVPAAEACRDMGETLLPT